MTDPDAWQEENSRWLSGALASIRQRLEGPGQPQTGTTASSRSLVERLLRKPVGGASIPSGGGDLRSGGGGPPDDEGEHPGKFRPALDILAERFGLSSFEKDILLLCIAVELDPKVPALCAQVQGGSEKGYPTFSLALSLFNQPSWDALSPDRPLRYWRLVEIHQPGSQPLTMSALRADERIVSYVKGLNYLDDRLTSILSLADPLWGPEILSKSQEVLAAGIMRRWGRSSPGLALPVMQLVGPDPAAKLVVATSVAAHANRQIYTLALESLPVHTGDVESLSRLWSRENLLLPIALYVHAEDLDLAPGERVGALKRFLTRAHGMFFLGVREPQTSLGHDIAAFDVSKPTSDEQRKAWNDALGPGFEETASMLASQFSLNLSSVQRLVDVAKADMQETSGALRDAVWDACRSSERPRLEALAQRIQAKATWDDLVLPLNELQLLHQIVSQVGQRMRVYGEWGFDQVMNRGLGITTLFAGESGTGKTMAAEVIANALRLDLYRIDISSVVNKYIGETEKNLRRLFDAAEDSGAILFFDEADALFGKRSEVKDSHDRYANIEVNYLLQRMEAYRGLAILATNMKKALDTGFMRRVRFVVKFPLPGPAERKEIWQKVFPAQVPVGQIDYDRLTRFTITGGNISSIALNAAFLAAQGQTSVTMPLVMSAVRTEYRKLEKPINEAEFRL